MRERRFTIITCAALCVMLAAALAQSDYIVIDNGGHYIKKQRTPVSFPHGRHMGVVPECRVCHHVYEKGKNVLDESLLVEENGTIRCAHCHVKERTGGNPDLMKAYHMQCIGCHRSMQKKGTKTGPVMCGFCHSKTRHP